VEQIRRFLDEDVHSSLSQILRKRGFDALHTQELKRKGFSDEEQLQYAINHQRCLMTFNVKNYVRLHNQFVMLEREHWGIIVSKQIPLTEALRRTLKVLQRESKLSMKNCLTFLPR